MNINILYFMTLVLWVLLVISFVKDRSRYRNCYILFFTIIFTIVSLIHITGTSQSHFINLIFVFIGLMLLIVPFFLIINGILMIKREGHSFKHLLSLMLGILIGAGEVATYFVVVSETIVSPWSKQNYLLDITHISAFFSVTVIYISMTFVVFMLYCLFLQIIPRKKSFDYVIIHGSGLIKGDRVSKLLSNRIDKAIEIYHKSSVPPKLIVSGGKGDDEKISEAEAMKQYILETGIPREDIFEEDKSTTTLENLKNSKAIIDSQKGSKETVLVTSNYHVYRALRYCRKIKLKCTGVGSHVAFYYWPSALIREYIAIHAEKKHIIMFIIGWLVSIFPLIMVYIYVYIY